jgi:hypothetical protein
VQVRTQAGLVETIPMEYLHKGRPRVVPTPFEIDHQIHIRLAVDGRQFEPFVLSKPSWEEMVRTAPDEATLFDSLIPYAEFSTSVKRDRGKIVKQWSAEAQQQEQPKWLQEAKEIWGLARGLKESL